MNKLDTLLQEVGACRRCRDAFGFEPRPVLRAEATARLLIAGQAPGSRVHESGVPWEDPSGDRLRDWLAVDRETFYDPSRVAIIPMGFCYPGQDAGGGDKPPPPKCAEIWHERILGLLPGIELVILSGAHAQKYYLGKERKKTMTETVRAWRDYGPRFIPLPHPSWRNTGWLKRHPWFAAEILPELRKRVRAVLGD
ncbi:MAG TPA: uracil-DNA glycosylase family protein [Alphaproteobacteria bacterium]|nr:uracil-DNA glycosylase family protein [Alphaproteobacteria bacterium]